MTSKVYYRPIEAAIRWSGLQRHEAQILAVLGNKQVPDPGDFSRWPALRLNCERIVDAIVNGELRYAVNGKMVVGEQATLTEADLWRITVRHVDLKAWMAVFYPECKPTFLFSRRERDSQPAIAVRLQIEPASHTPEALPIRSSNARSHRPALSIRPSHSAGELGPRSETTYLHIVGGLLSVMLGRSASGKPNSSFRSQEAIINAMIAEHGDRLGITERTLEAKFAAAKRALHRE